MLVCALLARHEGVRNLDVGHRPFNRINTRRLAEKALAAVVQEAMCMASRPGRSTISSKRWA